MTKTPGSVAANRFPAFVDLVRRQLARDYPADALQRRRPERDERHVAVGAGAVPKRAVARTLQEPWSNKRRPPLQAGLVVTDVHNGEVLAVVGSRNVDEHGFNRAVEAQRPVGSLLKPFVYLLALAQPGKYSLASWVDDSPVTVDAGQGQALEARQFRRPQPRHACA